MMRERSENTYLTVSKYGNGRSVSLVERSLLQRERERNLRGERERIKA